MPTRFRFRLDPLLRTRRAAEQDKQRAVAVIERERIDLEARLRRLQGEVLNSKQEMSQDLVGPVDMGQLRQHAAATLDLIRKAQQTVLELAGVHQRLDSARNEFLEARKDRRAIELLKDKRLEQWKTGQAKRETAEIDDLVVMGAARKRDGRQSGGGAEAGATL